MCIFLKVHGFSRSGSLWFPVEFKITATFSLSLFILNPAADFSSLTAKVLSGMTCNSNRFHPCAILALDVNPYHLSNV